MTLILLMGISAGLCSQRTGPVVTEPGLKGLAMLVISGRPVRDSLSYMHDLFFSDIVQWGCER
jgi:hypothetical protein